MSEISCYSLFKSLRFFCSSHPVDVPAMPTRPSWTSRDSTLSWNAAELWSDEVSCRAADPVHFRPDPDPENQNFNNRIRILLVLIKNVSFIPHPQIFASHIRIQMLKKV